MNKYSIGFYVFSVIGLIMVFFKIYTLFSLTLTPEEIKLGKVDGVIKNNLEYIEISNSNIKFEKGAINLKTFYNDNNKK